MKTIACISDNILYFSHWSGKGYAVFAALGRQVRIAGLALHICFSALMKSARKGLIVNSASAREENEIKETDKQMRKRTVVCFHQGEVCPGKMKC